MMSLTTLLRPVQTLLALGFALAVHAAPLPVAPKENGLALDDTVAFSWADGSKAYIPEYQIATYTVGLSGGGEQQRYRMQLTADGADWLFTVHLLAQPSPRLKIAPEQMASARPLADPPPRVSLSYEVPAQAGGFRRERSFQSVQNEPGGVKATLRLTSLNDQTELGAALSKANAKLQLSVLRQADVQVELPFPDPSAKRFLDDLQLQQVQLQRDQAAYLDLQRLLPPDQASTLQQVKNRITLKERELGDLQRQAATLQMRTRLEKMQLQLPQQVRSEAFDASQHPYMVQVPIKREDHAIGLLQRAVGGRRYYQDNARPQRFYYLPDQFELARDAAGKPRLAIRATEQETRYRIEYVAEPSVTPGRLDKDRPRLAEIARLPASSLEFEPLTADALTLKLNLPHDDQWREAERPNALSSLNRPFTDLVQLSAEELRLLYDALFSRFPLFHGTVTAHIGNWANETVPFVGQIQGEPEEIWETVFDPSIPPAFRRKIQIRANPNSFATADALTVMLENGPTIELNKTQPEASASIGQAVGDYVLRRQDDGGFRYRLTWRSGANVVDGGMRSGTGTMLLLNANDLVPR